MSRSVFIFLLSMLLFSCSGGSSDKPKVASPPVAAILVSPENNEVCFSGEDLNENESRVFFNWNPSEHTDHYDIEITDLISAQKQSIKNLTSTSASVILKKGQPYQWLVISKSTEVVTTAVSKTWKFYLEGNGVSNYAPFPAKLITPLNNSAFTLNADQNCNFSWEGSDPDQGDVLSYTLYLDTTDGLQDPPESYKNIKGQSISIKLGSGTTYYWRIKTSDGKSSSFSQVYKFTTRG